MQKTIPFTEFELNTTLLDTIEAMGFEYASDIQELTIDPIIDGEDIFAQAETGSGKTAAFAIPLLEKAHRDDIIEREDEEGGILYVVMSPTRELAQQTHKVFSQLGKDLGVISQCVIGGENIDTQIKLLESNPHVLVATPGRLCDLIKQKKISLSNCLAVVFDEADRLFDMGFKKDIEFILGLCPKDRQLIMVSATTNIDVLNTAYKFHSDPIEIKVNEDSLVVENIDQKLAMVSSEEKMPFLVNELRHYDDAYALIFCNTQIETHRVAEWLKLMGFKANAISGRLSQNKRTSLMKDFRSKKITILVCTDVAARGLDIKDVNLVINYDMPQDAANYVHRVGRTARAGKTGEAISLCAPEDCEFVDSIYKLIECEIPKIRLYNDDFADDVCPRPFIDRRTLKIVDKAYQRNEKGWDSPDSVSKIKDNALSITTAEKVGRSQASSNRVFKIQASSYRKARNAAMKFFNIKYANQLRVESETEGRKRFFLFGKRLVRFEFGVRPTYKKIILPFLIELLKRANLDLYTNFSFDGRNIRISLSGRDEKELTRNKGELLEAIEYITRLHLYNSIDVPRDIKIFFRSKEENKINDNQLIKLVNKMAEQVLSNKKTVRLRPMNAAERRIVHKHIESITELKTTSVGEGRMKRIEISLTQ